MPEGALQNALEEKNEMTTEIYIDWKSWIVGFAWDRLETVMPGSYYVLHLGPLCLIIKKHLK